MAPVVYMKMPVSVRIFSSFVVPVPGMEVRNIYCQQVSISTCIQCSCPVITPLAL
ncbi:MAG: hypothetical protein ABFD51_12820 [Anaerolineaceae bacterium]